MVTNKQKQFREQSFKSGYSNSAKEKQHKLFKRFYSIDGDRPVEKLVGEQSFLERRSRSSGMIDASSDTRSIHVSKAKQKVKYE